MPTRLSQTTRRPPTNSYSRTSRVSGASSQGTRSSLHQHAHTSLPDDAGEGDEAADEEEEALECEEDEGSDGEIALRMPKRRRMNEHSGAKSAADRLGRKEINRRAQDLVRMALFHEYKRAPLRRDDINKAGESD